MAGPTPKNEELTAAVASVRDEEAPQPSLEESEEALRQERQFVECLVDMVRVIVLVLDDQGRILRFNRYLEEISGYRLEEVRGKSWFDVFLRPEDRTWVRQVFTHAISGDHTRGSVNAIVTRDGREREIEWYDTTLTDATGEPDGVLAVGLDVTDRMRLEQEVRQAQKMEAIGRLAGGVAHDFNTLLASISGYAEMLLEGGGEDSRRRAGEQILKSAERGTALTRQLLAFSRRQVLAPRVLDLNAVLRDLDDMLERLLGSGIELVYALDPEPAVVEVDAGQIEQVILNLVVNAADAMPEGGRITLATRPAAGPGKGGAPERGVELVVRDTGCGMDEETRSHIFEPFFTTKEQGKGTGLGLSTVYGIVKQSGGEISVESRPGDGATFRVLLPRAEGEWAEEKAAPAAWEEAGDSGGSETVLLVEDDEMFRQLLTEVFEGRGYRVLAASGPAEAFLLCERQAGTVDLMVSDMVMPGMSGSELAARLGGRYPGIKHILMSGYSPEDLADRGLDDPGLPLIQKPFSTRDLLQQVRGLLDGEA